MKTCAKCKIEKPLSDYWTRKTAKGTIKPRSRCRSCENEDKRDYTKRHPEKKAASDRRYYEKHTEQIKAKIQEWNENNRDRSNAIKKRWDDRNPEKVRAIATNKAHRRRLALEKSSMSSRYIQWLRSIFVLHGNCPVCGCSVDGTTRKWWLEHDVPISKGGEHSEDNVFYDCNKCNNEKKAKTLVEYCGLTIQEVFKRVGI